MHMILQALIIYNELLYVLTVLTWQHQFSTTMAIDHLQWLTWPSWMPGMCLPLVGAKLLLLLWVVVVVVGCWLLGCLVGSFVPWFVCLFVCSFVCMFCCRRRRRCCSCSCCCFRMKINSWISCFFLKPLPVRLSVLRYQKSLAKRTIR